jgi:replicative DNA helicase
MDKQQAKDYIKGELGNYLTSTGRDIRKPFICINPAHQDKSPSMGYDRKRNKAHCFSCGADYDTIDVIGIDYGITDLGEKFKKAYEYFNIGWGPETTEHTHNSIHKDTPEQETDYTAFFEEAHRNITKTDYPQRRGIGEAIINRFNLGYVENWRHPKAPTAPVSPRLIIPTSKYSYLARDTRAKLTEEQREYSKSKAGTVRIFNSSALQTADKPIFITEGEIDALSIMEVGGEAVAIGSAANWRALLKYLGTQQPAQPLIIALDNDSAGERAERDLAESLQALSIPYCVLKPYGEHKDANEALQANREVFKAAIEELEQVAKEAKPTEDEAQDTEQAAYLETSAAHYIQDFINGIAESVNTPFIPTGFNKLDAVLDGGLYEGLYIVGAISSLGKTTLITQMADNIAQGGNDVLIFSLEMARAELMAKSISRHTLEITLASGGNTRNAKTTRGITTGKRYPGYSQTERDLIVAAIRAYKEYAGHIFISEGIGDIGAAQVREAAQNHFSLTGRTPTIIIDYLQILAPHSERMTDKQNTDKAVMELKRVSRDFKTPVLAISSFNRQSYNSPVTMEAFKESGAVEYSSDVLIGLQLAGAGENGFNPNEEKQRTPRNIELVMLKNRNGRTGDKIKFEYHPQFNYFIEN